MNLRKGNVAIVGLLLGIILILIVAVAYLLIQKSPGATFPSTLQSFLPEQKPQVPSNWKTFRNDALGLEFRYPPEWGEPVIGPNTDITDLSTYLKKFNHEGNYYQDSLEISFSDEGLPSVRIYNGSHKGDLYPNANANQSVYIDNFQELKKTGDICKYKIVYDDPLIISSYREKYTRCSFGVVSYLTLHTQYVMDKYYYSYDLVNASYKRLKNGIFDDLMATQLIAHIPQAHDENLGLQTFLEAAKMTKADYESKLNSFTIFANSIKSYVPPKIVPPAPAVIQNGDQATATISKYYQYLTNKDFENAYTLYSDKTTSFETFKSWYENVFYANPRDFVKVGENTYQFYVDYQDENSPVELYRVTMKALNGKITTLLSEHFQGKMAQFGKMKAYVKDVSGVNYVVFVDGNGSEKILEKNHKINPSNLGLGGMGYSIVGFSPNGDYLTYDQVGWEWTNLKTYNIANGTLDKGYGGATDYIFSDDGKYAALCIYNHMGGEFYGRVFSTIGEFNVIFDLEKATDVGKFFNLSCNYDSSTNSFKFLIDTMEGNSQVALDGYSYNLDTKSFVKPK